MTITAARELLNYIGGEWRRSSASDYLEVRNPATPKRSPRCRCRPKQR